ncbi:glycyl-tRNA synthetase, alpha subunit domain protein [Anaplasma phagocytophilum str. Annie]|nr:glycyl-tRNA synthetase, alpha subunit domain protein [Anaplasma phagocytophilum str. Annie]
MSGIVLAVKYGEYLKIERGNFQLFLSNIMIQISWSIALRKMKKCARDGTK